MFRIARSYSSCLGHIWGGAATALFEHQTEEELLLHEAFGEGHRRIQAVFLKGTNLRRLLPDPTSTILTQRADGATGIILMRVENASSENDARARAKQLSDSIDALEPESFGPVIQRMVAGKSLTDFRSGMVVHAEPSADEFRALLLSALPLPAEMQSQLTD
jgi:hypothetical protein